MHGDWRIICAHDGLLASKQFGEGDRIERSDVQRLAACVNKDECSVKSERGRCARVMLYR